MHRHLKPNTDEVASKVVDGEAILINLTNGMYYSLDSVGGYIWTLVSDGHDLDAITAAVVAHYDVAGETAKADVDAFAQSMLDEAIVVAAETAEGEAGTPVSPADSDYATPQLTKFDDMVDLFALDPPLPELSKVSGGAL